MWILATLTGCVSLCGDYTVATNVWFDHTMGDLYEGDPTGSPYDVGGHDFWPLDGEYAEECGKRYGTFGNWDLLGDGRAIMWFDPFDRDFSRDINGLAMELWVSIPVSSMVAGTTLGLDELLGEARLKDMSGEPFKLSPLTEATITIDDGVVDGNPCEEHEGWAQGVGPAFHVTWDVTWSNGVDATFTASGSDEVFFDTFLSEACPSVTSTFYGY